MIAAIENALLERLQSAKALGLFGYQVKTIACLDGELTGAETLAALSSLMPGFWVSFLDEAKTGDAGQGEHRMKATFRVAAAAGGKRAASGAGNDAGAYRMVLDARALLAGQRLGLAIDYLEPIGVHVFPAIEAATPGLSVMAVEFAASYVATDNPDQSGACLALPSGPEGPPSGLGLAEAMAIGAGITGFRTTRAAWTAPRLLTDILNLET